ncbi:type VI secretion system baseplate subunit TssF [Marinobacter subterrani]|uniref:Uncharacterized protein n=1 Tax=Marinobacter subterrani TaxID=1658765 RepID=A0A0J7JG93_9GAMM|nr:Bacterial protein of unknown function (DUF879) [Marinobacter subterrani]
MLTRFLSEQSTDTDVERLLEGFAFLTDKLREKVEDEFPEITHSLLNMLWPNYLRPVPICTIMRFHGYEVNAMDERDLARINTVVRVENNLVAMLDSASLIITMRPVRITRTPTRRGLRTAREILAEAPEALIEQPLTNGKALYIAMPPSQTFETFFGQEAVTTHELLIRAQWWASVAIDGIGETLVVPAPELHDRTAFNRDTHGEPDFTETGQLFWANERSHRPDETI